MLVLTRKVGEKFYVPEIGLTVTILKQSGNKLSIGIDAPRQYTILRGELDVFTEDEDERAA